MKKAPKKDLQISNKNFYIIKSFKLNKLDNDCAKMNFGFRNYCMCASSKYRKCNVYFCTCTSCT